ncbi:hypothetical protein GALMADRAFT_224544 [Galerina marginata CBS 339.88]|uniref:Uncharacterized protein n=1 Tax=Galerina marginata (strain CBS 339.88) TaxID=685588 RepID=A0A067TGR3_GALM3|nr:hypothetical protein GALMADRAFT_224544 [Galerina marginata CBS 339.88]
MHLISGRTTAYGINSLGLENPTQVLLKRQPAISRLVTWTWSTSSFHVYMDSRSSLWFMGLVIFLEAWLIPWKFYEICRRYSMGKLHNLKRLILVRTKEKISSGDVPGQNNPGIAHVRCIGNQFSFGSDLHKVRDFSFRRTLPFGATAIALLETGAFCGFFRRTLSLGAPAISLLETRVFCGFPFSWPWDIIFSLCSEFDDFLPFPFSSGLRLPLILT